MNKNDSQNKLSFRSFEYKCHGDRHTFPEKMGDDRNNIERQEFQDEFRLAVFQLLQYIGNERHRIRPDFREWRLQRIKTIEKLDELREKLDKTCVAASYDKGIGIGATVAGDLTSILATVMELQQSSSAQNLMNIGNLFSHSGSLLEGASNAVESFVSAQHVLEIEEVLKRDQELSTPLQDWLACSRNMDANIREIFGSDLNFARYSGSLLEGASNAVESFVSAQYLLEIEEVLKRDQELSTPLQDWLAFSRNMDANIREIFGYDLNFAVQNNVLNVFSEFIKLYDSSRDFQQTIDLMRLGSYSIDMSANVPIKRLLRFSSQVEIHPDLQDNIRTICSVLATSSRTIQVASEGARVYRSLLGEENFSNRSTGNVGSHHAREDPASPENPNVHENDGVSEGSSELPTGRNYNREPPTVREASTFCVFKGINMAIKIVNLSTVIMTIRDGKSKYFQDLQQISNLLSMELRSMETLRC